MLLRMPLKKVLAEVGGLENATKKQCREKCGLIGT